MKYLNPQDDLLKANLPLHWQLFLLLIFHAAYASKTTRMTVIAKEQTRNTNSRTDSVGSKRSRRMCDK